MDKRDERSHLLLCVSLHVLVSQLLKLISPHALHMASDVGETKPGQLCMHMGHCATDPVKVKAFTYCTITHTQKKPTTKPVKRETLIIRKLHVDRHEASVFWACVEENWDLSISVCKVIPESSWPLASFICSWSPDCGRVNRTLIDPWTHTHTHTYACEM